MLICWHFPLFFTLLKAREEWFHVTWLIHTTGTHSTKFSQIISAKPAEVLSHLPIIMLGLTFTICFAFSSPHAAPNRCVLAKSISSQGLAGKHAMGHDYFAEVTFLSYCILSCHCSSCQRAGVAGKASYTDSLERTFQWMLLDLNVTSLCQILFVRLEMNHYVDNGLGVPDTLQTVKACKSSKSVQSGFAVLPFTC